MKLRIQEIDNVIATEYLLKDKTLASLALSDNSLKDLEDGFGYNPDPCGLTGFYNNNDNTLVCFIQANLFTESTILVHVFLRSDLHHSGVLKPITEMYAAHISKYFPLVKKVMIISPESCIHVHKAIKKLGFVQEGCLTKSMIWREKLEDILIFGRSLHV